MPRVFRGTPACESLNELGGAAIPLQFIQASASDAQISSLSPICLFSVPDLRC
jgi:hypothetical protein